jgi:hypothetical protein
VQTCENQQTDIRLPLSSIWLFRVLNHFLWEGSFHIRRRCVTFLKSSKAAASSDWKELNGIIVLAVILLSDCTIETCCWNGTAHQPCLSRRGSRIPTVSRYKKSCPWNVAAAVFRMRLSPIVLRTIQQPQLPLPHHGCPCRRHRYNHHHTK